MASLGTVGGGLSRRSAPAGAHTRGLPYPPPLAALLPQVGQPLPAPIPKAELAADYLVLPCAIVRGALAGLGLEASVTADATSLPQVDFTVVLRQAPAR